ncbi:unnamed protein product [Mytilus edulis]|uniref:PHD-type domain-containing protein n=1 Tax=Mytilus edulis TaxID=6550 RepID=A0A8S3T1R4_MYTED|nr:unnamed protein product [Mytilus edulis]
MAKQDPRWTKLKPSKMLLFFLLLMIMKSNDIQTNPGPSNDSTKYLCGTCDQSVNWDHKGIVCETCDQWFHINCQGIHSKSYEDLNDSMISWHCIICDKPNYSTVLFDLHSIESPNPFSSLYIGDINHSNPPSSPDYQNQNIKPLHASTPIQKEIDFIKIKKSGNPSLAKRYKEVKHQVQKSIRKSYWEYIESIILPPQDETNFGTLKKKFGPTLNIKTDYSGITEIKQDGKLLTDPLQKAGPLNAQFQSVFTPASNISHTEFVKQCNMPHNTSFSPYQN